VPLRNYRLTVRGAAADADEYRERLRKAVDSLEPRFLTGRADGDDLLVNVVFDVPDDPARRRGIAERLLAETRQVLPPELHDRLVLEDQPDRAHEVSAQLLADMRRGTTILPAATQSPEDLEAWESFLSRTRPRGLIELGTASGSFSRWLSERVVWFRTFDIQKPARRTPGFVHLDVWKRPEEVHELISLAPRPFVLFCDDGHKQREVATFAPALRVGDFLAVHDLGTEIFPENVPAGFAERLVGGLTGFFERVS
jgi:hypothetical protein